MSVKNVKDLAFTTKENAKNLKRAFEKIKDNDGARRADDLSKKASKVYEYVQEKTGGSQKNQ